MTMVDKRTIDSHGLAQMLKLFLDSLDLQQYGQEIKDNPYLRDLAKAIGYERKK